MVWVFSIEGYDGGRGRAEMRWIGLTGGIATGKSTVSQLLRERGYAVVDADLLAREAVQTGTKAHREISQVFGPDAVSSDGQLNRARIGEIVFSDRSKLNLLESIIHPEVRRLALEKRSQLSEAGAKAAFYDVPLLFEKNMEDLFDEVVVVATNPVLQKSRLILRNGFSPEEAEKRIASQIPINEKTIRANFVIENNGSLSDLEAAVDAYLKRTGLLR